MGRIRTIKPEFPQSESVGRLSRDARLLFIQLWTFVDDSGRTRGASRLLASALYPYDDDAPKLIEGWLSELESQGMVRRYVADDGNAYIDIPKWLDHQKIDKPSASRLPAYEEQFDEHSPKPRESSATDMDRRTISKDRDREAGPGGDHAAGAACVEPATPASTPNDDTAVESPTVLEIPCVGSGPKVYQLTEAKVAEYARTFPAVDVLAECRKARQWCIDKPTKRKTFRGVPAFLSGWLGRVQDSGGGALARAGPVNGKPTPADKLADRVAAIEQGRKLVEARGES